MGQRPTADGDPHEGGAIIIGAGPGGLAAALALQHVGIPVRVFEAAPELRPVGAGLTLWANAVKVADQLGLGAAIRAAGASAIGGETRSWRGTVLNRLTAAQLERAFGAANVAIHRADLQAAMLAALAPGVVQTGARCIGVSQDAASVCARFADGREARGALLVGADGIHSVVRAGLFGAAPPRYAGYTAWRGVTHFPAPPGRAAEGFIALGPGRQFGFVPIGGGRVYWFGTRNTAAGGQDAPGGHRRAVLAGFARWHAPIPAVIEATSETAILRNDIYDRPPLPHWSVGRVTLLGDAAHPMTPNLGQGACQALEDAVVLAQCLAAGAAVPAALVRYEGRRRPRTASVAQQSWRFGQIIQLGDPLLCRLRDAVLRRIPPGLQIRQLAPVVGYEV